MQLGSMSVLLFVASSSSLSAKSKNLYQFKFKSTIIKTYITNFLAYKRFQKLFLLIKILYKNKFNILFKINFITVMHLNFTLFMFI